VYFNLLMFRRGPPCELLPYENCACVVDVLLQDITLQEAETLALTTLKQVMEEKVRILYISTPASWRTQRLSCAGATLSLCEGI